VLVVVRTITTVSWLFALLPELFADQRVQVVFALNGEPSAYEAGVIDAVREIGGRVLPWEQAITLRFSLAISASHYGGLERLRSPLLILPHGPGHTRKIGVPSDGYAPRPAVPAGRASAPVTVALTHGEQRRQWQTDPDSRTRAVVTGDPCFDQLRASLRDRKAYRQAFGVARGQRLLVVSSTWGPQSAFALRPTLPAELLAEFPADEYVVAAILHANIWVGHGPWQVRVWLQRALEAGLRLVPYREGWRSAIAAADCVIGDHGSVTFYAAMLGVPTIHSSFGDDELVSATPLAALGERAPRLASDIPLRLQIEQVGFELNADRYADLRKRAFANEGRALNKLRDLVYQLVDLHPPSSQPRTLPASLPRIEGRAPTAWLVFVGTELTGAHADCNPHMRIERFPATLEPTSNSGERDLHLAVSDAERDLRLRESAAVIVRSQSRTSDSGPARALEPSEAIAWAEETLANYPGCSVAAVSLAQSRLLVLPRDLSALSVEYEHIALDETFVASALYYALITGSLIEDQASEFYIDLGGRENRIRFSPLNVR
jgi:hypothetical protein